MDLVLCYLVELLFFLEDFGLNLFCFFKFCMYIFDGFLLEAVCLLKALQDLLEFCLLVDNFLDSFHLFEEDVSYLLIFMFGKLENL